MERATECRDGCRWAADVSMPEQEREMSEKWIPGQWNVADIEKGSGQINVVATESDGIVLYIAGAIAGFPPAMQEANAHLIAAAPDLYEALADGEELIAVDLVDVEWKQACAAFLDKARRALSRARGE